MHVPRSEITGSYNQVPAVELDDPTLLVTTTTATAAGFFPSIRLCDFLI